MKPSPSTFPLALVLGLLFLFSGAFLVLQQLDLLDSPYLQGGWPLLLVGIGLGQILFGEPRWAKVVGSLVVLFGGVLLLADLDASQWLDAGSYVWRLAVASGGLALVLYVCLQARQPESAPEAVGSTPNPSSEGAHDRLRVFSLMANQKHRVSSRAFGGGHLGAVMGSYEVDLRGADLPEGREVVIDVFSLMGEARVRVPDDWTIVSEVVPILAEARSQSEPRSANPRKRLRIRGVAVMSDIEIRSDAASSSS